MSSSQTRRRKQIRRGNQLITHITASDDKILSDAAAGLEGWHIQESTRYGNAIQEQCFESVTDGYIAQVRKRERLAAETKQTSLFDADRWFADDPEGAKKNFEDECYFAVNGHHPPDVQAVIDENRKLAKQQAQRFLEEKRREGQKNDN